jgi:hypothetical protein
MEMSAAHSKSQVGIGKQGGRSTSNQISTVQTVALAQCARRTFSFAPYIRARLYPLFRRLGAAGPDSEPASIALKSARLLALMRSSRMNRIM